MSKHRQKTSTSLLFRKLQRKLSPAQIIVLSFLLIIIIGGLLLSLPFSQSGNVQVSVGDAFFTSVSAVCVTGLLSLTTATSWSFFGKLLILVLIQIGGLSLISIYTFFMVNIGRKISLKNRLVIQSALNKASIGGSVRMVIMAIKGTLICELAGAILLFFSFLKQGLVWHKALFYGIFHSVSAFCNAGFDIIGEDSLVPYADSFSINIIIMLLVILGGIGFVVWQDIFDRMGLPFRKGHKKRTRLSLHTKLVLITTGVLLFLGSLFFFLAEYNNPATLGELSLPRKITASAFLSANLRTAGFYTFAQEGLTGLSKLFSGLLMLVGGSPGGTAGGIKTISFAIILCSVWSIIRGRSKIVVFRREIPTTTLQKALAIVVLMLSLLFAGTLLLSFTERNIPFSHTVYDLIFELSAALGTTGISTGITPFLTGIGRAVLMLFMFIGRIGPISLIISLSLSLYNRDEGIGYPSEDVMIG